MKMKSLITTGLLLFAAGVATTSCEDMFTAENNLVATDLAPQDTVYQMMGIVQRMQKLADRTVLLGEVRADLVEVDPKVASTDVQQLGNNDVSTDNVYNQPADYYAVINSCNIYLANADATLKSHGQLYYEKEICAAKCFRAWCYLELAKIYGSVPLVTEPVLTADAAEDIVASGKKADMSTILTFCINDLKDYAQMSRNLDLRPSYGGSIWNGINFNNFFIPVRALLAELYLWKASFEQQTPAVGDLDNDYVNAIRMYHDYFCFPNEEHAVRGNSVEWGNRDHLGTGLSSYEARFAVNATEENAAVLPCDTVAYYGNVSDLRTVFNSQYANNYYPWVSPAQRLRKISASQLYCYYDYNLLSPNASDTLYFSQDANDYTRSIQVGDLRLSASYQTGSNTYLDENSGDLNATLAWVTKWSGGARSFLRTDVKNAYIPFFRNTILYLHLAEALNRAGFPETAFAILKYGLTYDVMMDRDIISQDEFDRLSQIKSSGFSLAEPYFVGDLAAQSNSSFVVWPSNVFENDYKGKVSYRGGTITQIGIHSIGSGDTWYNKRYYLPTDSGVVSATIDADHPTGVVPVPAVLPEPAIVDDPGELLTIEEFCAAQDPALDPTKAASRTQYALYQRNYNTAKAAYDAWVVDYPPLKAAYDASVAAHNLAVTNNANWLKGTTVREGRQAELTRMILEEEALEGMFEGLRFYDLMRFQMQEGKLGTTITMPDCVTEKYGDSQRAGMVGRPWYLPLPTR